MSRPHRSKARTRKRQQKARGSAAAEPRQLTPSDPQAEILALQRTVGNRAVSQLLQSNSDRLEPAASEDRIETESSIPSEPLEGTSPQVRMEEAISQAAVRAFERRLIETIPSAPIETAPPEAAHLISGAGDGVDVTIHRGGAAGQLLTNADTPAATVGPHVALAPDAPSLQSSEGRRVLAHEVAHAVQQRSLMPKPQGTLTGRHEAEVEASLAADRALSGLSPGTLSPAPMVHFVGGGAVVVNVAKRAAIWLAKKGANVSAHIAKRHIAKRLGKSTFTQGGKSVKKWVTETLEHSDNVVDQGRRMVFEKTFGHDVGRGGERIVRVVVDKATGKIVTAFPTNAFKTIVGVAAGIASSAATEADAAILARRKAIAEALEPGWVESVIDFFMGSSSVARDEDILIEQRMIEDKIQEAITAIEDEMQMSLSPEDRAEVREIILTEMETEPTAG